MHSICGDKYSTILFHCYVFDVREKNIYLVCSINVIGRCRFHFIDSGVLHVIVQPVKSVRSLGTEPPLVALSA